MTRSETARVKQLRKMYTIGPCVRNHVVKSGTIFDRDPMNRIQCDPLHLRPGEGRTA